ncbi:MAG: sigma-70 family RNA polymerase sigma factor [Phycisphaerales bacterium]
MAEQASNPSSGDRQNEERSLLLALHAGNEQAARELWDRYAGRLRLYARSLTSDALADDIVQGVFLDVLRLRRSRVRAVEDPAAWLCSLTRNAALNARRGQSRRSRRETVGVLTEDRATLPGNPDDPASDILDGLPQPWREAVLLRHAYGFTLERLADALGVSRSTAADRYGRGIALARELATQAEQPKEEASRAC